MLLSIKMPKALIIYIIGILRLFKTPLLECCCTVSVNMFHPKLTTHSYDIQIFIYNVYQRRRQPPTAAIYSNISPLSTRYPSCPSCPSLISQGPIAISQIRKIITLVPCFLLCIKLGTEIMHYGSPLSIEKRSLSLRYHRLGHKYVF